MKRLIRHWAIDTYALYLTTTIAGGIQFENGIRTLLLAGLGFMGASLLAKPVINVLLLPINLVTFGMFRWVSAAVVLYLVTLLVPNFRVANFDFPGFSSRWVDIPALYFEGFLSFVAFSFIISVITSIIYWLVK